MDPRATVTTDILGSRIVVTDYSYNQYDHVGDSWTNPVIVIPAENNSYIIQQVINIFLVFYEYVYKSLLLNPVQSPQTTL
jgi:hypothetical protein